MISTLDEIRNRLLPLSPTTVTLTDQSHLHQGHAGNTGGSHLDLCVVSAAFAGKSPVERHRMVYALLADLIPQRIHALSIKAQTPEES